MCYYDILQNAFWSSEERDVFKTIPTTLVEMTHFKHSKNNCYFQEDLYFNLAWLTLIDDCLSVSQRYIFVFTHAISCSLFLTVKRKTNHSDNSQTSFKYQREPKLVRLWVEAAIKGTRRVWDVNRGQFFLLLVFVLLHVQLLWGLCSLFLLLLLRRLTSCEFLLSLKCSNKTSGLNL